MTFLRTFDTLLTKSNNDIYRIISSNGITLYNSNSSKKSLPAKKILNGNFSFLDYWFDIDNDDNLYGVINDKQGSLLYVYLTSKCIVKNSLLKYDLKLKSIKFVNIKKRVSDTNLIFYLIDNNDSNNCKLIHHYKKDRVWNKYTIDLITYEVLTNFVVIYDDNYITIFYFKLVNGFEEIFTSSFNNSTFTWSVPEKITSTGKHKIYLSAIKDTNDCYHIIFSENHSNKYYCTYINGYINDNIFNLSKYIILSDTVACTFPNIIQYNNNLYANWVEFHNLYTCCSKNFGQTWSNAAIDRDSINMPFICCNYHSNSIYDKNLNSFTFFRDEQSSKILGIN